MTVFPLILIMYYGAKQIVFGAREENNKIII